MSKRKLIEDFPEFNSFFPIFASEEIKEKCHAFLQQTYNRNHKEAGKWKLDKEKLKKEVIDYCSKNNK